MAVKDARPGMKLARAILNTSGIAIFGEGIALTEPIIDRIRAAGITSLYVMGRKTPAMPLKDELDALDRRFRKTETIPQMAVLKRIVREHIESLYRAP